MNTKQPLALYKEKMLEVNKLSPAEINHIKKEKILCPVCKEEGSINITDEGPFFFHSAQHEPETRHRALSKKILTEQLRYIFSKGTVERNIAFAGQIADIALLHPGGARIAIRYITGNETTETLPLWREALLQEKIHFLPLLDASRLPKGAREKETTEARRLTLGKTESTLLSLGEDLLYFQRSNRLLHLPEISPRIKDLARKTAGKRIGQVPVIFYRHKLSALRVLRGRWHLDNSYNDPSPVYGFQEKFPEALENNLGQLGI